MNVSIGYELILSAGAINSPKLLMLSGVGPEEDLKRSNTYQKYYVPMLNKTGFMNAVAMVQPRSRGTVKLNSTNPDASPLIDLQFLAAQEDVDKIVN
ncbi:hypothetical protein MTO96_036163, partial [Rhipicephalus appendiculatus]